MKFAVLGDFGTGESSEYEVAAQTAAFRMRALVAIEKRPLAGRARLTGGRACVRIASQLIASDVSCRPVRRATLLRISPSKWRRY